MVLALPETGFDMDALGHRDREAWKMDDFTPGTFMLAFSEQNSFSVFQHYKLEALNFTNFFKAQN